jgi:hypothetical protein
LVAKCIEYALFCTSPNGAGFRVAVATHGYVQTKSLIVNYLWLDAIGITQASNFGAASAPFHGNKEAANSSTMTLALSTRHFPNRSGWRNGAFDRLS